MVRRLLQVIKFFEPLEMSRRILPWAPIYICFLCISIQVGCLAVAYGPSQVMAGNRRTPVAPGTLNPLTLTLPIAHLSSRLTEARVRGSTCAATVSLPRTLWYLAQGTTAPDSLSRECLAPLRSYLGFAGVPSFKHLL